MLYLPSVLSKITRRLFMKELLSALVPNVVLCRSLSLSQRTWVGGHRFRPNVPVVSGRRFLPNFGHLEFIYFWVQQPSELSVEERNLLSGPDKFPSYRWCSI